MRRSSISAALLMSLSAACSGGGFLPGVNGNGGEGGAGSLDGGGSNSNLPGLPQCEEITLSADQAVPNMLIVLDRSTSMTENESNTDRWSGSVDAVTTVVSELEDQIRFGLMTFPSSRSRGDQCAPGELDEPIQIMNAGAINGTLRGMRNQGYTPTAQTLAEARSVMSEQQADYVGEFPLAQYVMLVTDGDPNCFSNQLTGDPQAQQASIDAVGALAADGVRVYVIGFQTGSSSFAGVLDSMAAAGGTGATSHQSVQSGDELLTEFRRIAGGAVSCSFVLAQVVDYSRVIITVNGERVDPGPDGWGLRDDGQTIDLNGATCDALQSGAAQVQATVSCSVVNPF